MTIKQRIMNVILDSPLEDDLDVINRVANDLVALKNNNNLKYAEDDLAITNAIQLLMDLHYILKGFFKKEKYE